MKKLLQLGLALAAVLLMVRGAPAEELVTEARPLDGRVTRIKLDGVINVRLRQGAVPSLTVTAAKNVLSKIITTQSGDTLRLDTESRGFKLFGLKGFAAHAELVLPELREFNSDGVGSSDVSGFTGEELDLSLDGAGSIKIACDYKKVSASLGGIGSMRIWLGDNDKTELDLHGAGHITLAGRSKGLSATLSGLGGLNAQQLQADSVKLDLSGLGNATVSARQQATLNLSGLGSVTVYGHPPKRDISVDGLGKVSWK